MRLEIDSAGRTRTVIVEPVKGRERTFVVTIDGVSRTVDAVEVAPGRLSILDLGDGHASLDAGLAPAGRPGELVVTFRGHRARTALDGGRSRRTAGVVESGGEQRVVAPMPGRVIRVLVAPGDQVEAQQPLVVVEAMKMENELSAGHGGRVRDVLVTEGLSVEAGRLLVVVE